MSDSMPISPDVDSSLRDYIYDYDFLLKEWSLEFGNILKDVLDGDVHNASEALVELSKQFDDDELEGLPCNLSAVFSSHITRCLDERRPCDLDRIIEFYDSGMDSSFSSWAYGLTLAEVTRYQSQLNDYDDRNDEAFNVAYRLIIKILYHAPSVEGLIQLIAPSLPIPLPSKKNIPKVNFLMILYDKLVTKSSKNVHRDPNLIVYSFMLDSNKVSELISAIEDAVESGDPKIITKATDDYFRFITKGQKDVKRTKKKIAKSSKKDRSMYSYRGD